MRKFIQSIFRNKTPDGRGLEPGPDSSQARPEPAQSNRPAGGPTGALELSDIIADLREFICAGMPDPLPPEEVDPAMHLYDAGYITSITAADLLAHIESHYGLDVSETELTGSLHNLDGLARHILSPES